MKTSLKFLFSTLKGWKQFRNNRKGLTSNTLSLKLNSIAILSEILRYFYDKIFLTLNLVFKKFFWTVSQDWGGTSQIHFTNIQDNRNTVWTRSKVFMWHLWISRPIFLKNKSVLGCFRPNFSYFFIFLQILTGKVEIVSRFGF